MILRQEYIKDRLLSLKDDELRKIVYVDKNDYEKEYIEFAKEELLSRYQDNIYEDDKLIFKKLLQNVTMEDIETRFLELYPKEEYAISSYRKVLEKLNNIEIRESENTIISIEDLNYEHCGDLLAMDVCGIDVNTGEKFEIKYCLWKDWLSFLTKKEQLREVGIIDFVILCLREMTFVSFDEDEIQKKFEEIVSISKEFDNAEELLVSNRLSKPYDGFIYEGIKKVQELNKESRNEKFPKIRPWIRYFARSIDVSIFFNIIYYPWFYFNTQSYKIATSFAFGIPFRFIEYFTWIFIEAFLISKLGYTLGKWLLNVKVRNNMNERLSYGLGLKRAWDVLLFGQGLTFPIISFVAGLVAYDRLANTGKTRWDEKGEFIVTHTKIEKYKIFTAVLILIVFPVIMYILKLKKII